MLDMMELFRRARWDQAYNFLASGDPPMLLKLLAINTLFLIMYMIRRAKSPHRMHESTVMQVQALLVAANALILFQSDIQRQIAWVIARI
jgi:hypothetical protein